MDVILDIGLIGLLAATLFHAIRLERALGVLKRDREALEGLVAAFNASTQAAESGVERLRAATDGAGQKIQRQIDIASALKDDLTFIVQRGEGLADRMDEVIRAARPATGAPAKAATAQPLLAKPFLAYQASAALEDIAHGTEARGGLAEAPRRQESLPARPADEPKVRSQAERDLLKALRMVR